MITVDTPQVPCPVCLSRVVLNLGELWVREDGTHRPLRIPSGLNAVQQSRIMRDAQVRCPNRTDEVPEHYLPYGYVTREPLVIALVGAPRSGKTHFLTSLIRTVDNEPLHDFGLYTTPLDNSRYDQFIATKIRRVFEDGELLDRTGENVWDFEVGLLVDQARGGRSRGRAVAFFDVAGDDLSGMNRAQKRVFLEGADGYVFVIDGDQLARGVPDSSFTTVLGLLDGDRKRASAATLVLSKADRFRFDHPVDRWLRAGPPTASPEEIERESRDLFAHIRRYRHADLWLRPWFEFDRSSIHAVSATGAPERPPDPSGAEQSPARYARPVRPQRVLQPFVSLLAMTGVIDTDGAGRVGR
ncbi:ATPase/DNA packaging protein [Nocardiopsis oceani]